VGRELGERGNIFKKHGLDLEILYTQAGPESIQALIAGSLRHRNRKWSAGRLRNFRQRSPDPHH
jgi:NitT/TauT family transport system substrate-binding protein